MTIKDAKRAARVLRDVSITSGSLSLTHSQALEIVARQAGYRDWNTMSAALDGASRVGIRRPVPVLRVRDEGVMRDFYVDYLGFVFEWEHRFERDAPLYARVRRDQMVIDLSEHHGDGTPGSVIWVPVDDLRGLHGELTGKAYPRMRPGIDEQAPGGPTMEVIDPYANVIRFCEVTG
ncbi:glyoxalase superfamily protein [Prauserella marina]|nr:glyoxalase superfamily protein [Prauserella marina]